jgi:hypothetical protein
MRSNRYIKVLGLLAALVALSAISAAVAQAKAPVWTVKASGVTKTINASEERESTASSTGTVILASNAQIVRSTTKGSCTASFSIKGSAAGSAGTVTPFTLTCKNVESSVANCTAHSTGAADGTIVTTELKGTLVWLAQSGGASADEVGVLFEPETAGGTFAHIEETGAACAVNTEGESLTVTGQLICKVTKGTGVDVTEGELECPLTSITKYYTNQTPSRTEDIISPLREAGSLALFIGNFDVKLKTSGEEGGIETG